MMDGIKAIRDLLFAVGRTVPPELWPQLLYKSPVVRSVLMSKETMALVRDASVHSHHMRERLAQALYDQRLITEEERTHLGIVQLGQRLAEHLRTLEKEDATP